MTDREMLCFAWGVLKKMELDEEVFSRVTGIIEHHFATEVKPISFPEMPEELRKDDEFLKSL